MGISYDRYVMGYLEYQTLLRDMQIADPESRGCKPAHLDTIFISTNFEEKATGTRATEQVRAKVRRDRGVRGWRAGLQRCMSRVCGEGGVSPTRLSSSWWLGPLESTQPAMLPRVWLPHNAPLLSQTHAPLTAETTVLSPSPRAAHTPARPLVVLSCHVAAGDQRGELRPRADAL